jgi:hypothetical protein
MPGCTRDTLYNYFERALDGTTLAPRKEALLEALVDHMDEIQPEGDVMAPASLGRLIARYRKAEMASSHPAEVRDLGWMRESLRRACEDKKWLDASALATIDAAIQKTLGVSETAATTPAAEPEKPARQRNPVGRPRKTGKPRPPASTPARWAERVKPERPTLAFPPPPHPDLITPPVITAASGGRGLFEIDEAAPPPVEAAWTPLVGMPQTERYSTKALEEEFEAAKDMPQKLAGVYAKAWDVIEILGRNMGIVDTVKMLTERDIPAINLPLNAFENRMSDISLTALRYGMLPEEGEESPNRYQLAMQRCFSILQQAYAGYHQQPAIIPEPATGKGRTL